MRFAQLIPIGSVVAVLASGILRAQEVPPVELDPEPASPEFPATGVAGVAPRAELVSGFKIVPNVDQPQDGSRPEGKPGDNATSHSASKQFVVHAKESEVRGTFCVFAEQVKTELLALLKQPDRWKYTIHIHVRGHTTAMGGGPPVVADAKMTEGGGFALRALVNLSRDFSRDGMRKELITLLLAERIVRAHPAVDFVGKRDVLPDWLRIGVSEAIEFRRRDRPTELFWSIYKSGRMLSVDEIISAKPGGMNSVSDAIYRASCCGFVLALTSQDQGSNRLRGMISDLAVFDGTPTALLAKHFPGTIDSENSLEKWWLLELATIAQPTVKDVLDPVASEAALGKCLQVRYPVDVPVAGAAVAEKPGGRRKVWQVFKPKNTGASNGNGAGETRREIRTADLSDYGKYIDSPHCDQIVTAAEVALLQLSWRAFPMHRPMIQEYQMIMQELRRGKTKGLDERFAALAAARVELARAAQDATDYLHHHQATKVGRMSGAFEDYKAAVDELNKPLPPREDRLSKYLDDLDKVYR